MAKGNIGGRPILYGTPKQMERKIVEYFKYTYPRSLTGLRMYLGFSSRIEMINYEEKEGFKELLRSAKLMMEY
jgi:hypothetical protein